jgi:hypothetical protein
MNIASLQWGRLAIRQLPLGIVGGNDTIHFNAA